MPLNNHWRNGSMSNLKFYTNLSPCWESTASNFNDTPYEGVLKASSILYKRGRVFNVDLENPDAKFLSIELIIRDGNRIRWDDHDWKIIHAEKHNDGTISFHIRRPKPNNHQNSK